MRAIRPIRRPTGTDFVSPAVALHGSSTWQAAGLNGAGVKVGIIDGGFSGIVARLGTDLPATVHAHCYTSVGSFTTSLADCANGETHGTAVAEAVFDMAPGVDLYVADPISRLDEKRAITWMTDNGIRVINASFYSGQIFEGPGDGTSRYANSLYSLVDQAVAGGARLGERGREHGRLVVDGALGRRRQQRLARLRTRRQGGQHDAGRR